ncbi:MAG: hypothetical protein FWG96_05545 [Methanomassiliicoccaceae archaeon]|nr:hypothetical protein [Methanomassiliicoccaceae archaeon]
MSGDEYILARIDVVAFSTLSKSVPRTDDVFDAIEALLSTSNEEIRRQNASRKKDFKLEARLYGDTIDIYFKTGDCDHGLILMLCDVVAKTQKEALCHGLFIKGSIVKGRLRITDEGFTGSAMVTAHDMEQACQYSCIVLADNVLELINEVAQEKFITNQDIINFTKNITVDRHFLNYLEACPFGFWKTIKPDLKVHRESLISAIERYNSILPDDPAKRKNYIGMYEHSLKNHNRVCEEHGAREELIVFRTEQINGITTINIQEPDQEIIII